MRNIDNEYAYENGYNDALKALKEKILKGVDVNDYAKSEWYEGYYDAKNEVVELINIALSKGGESK